MNKIIVLICYLLAIVFMVNSRLDPKLRLYCYYNRQPSIPSFSKALTPQPGSIFFLETSCTSESSGYLSVIPRHACSIESAARIHPNKTVYLLFTSPGIFSKFPTIEGRGMEALRNYSNIRIYRIHIEDFTRDSWLHHGLIYESCRMELNAYGCVSNALRLIALQRFGGIYLDLDMVLKKPLDTLGENFIGLLNTKLVGTSIMAFNHEEEPFGLLDIWMSILGRQTQLHSGRIHFTRYLYLVCIFKNTKKNNQRNTKLFNMRLFRPQFRHTLDAGDDAKRLDICLLIGYY